MGTGEIESYVAATYAFTCSNGTKLTLFYYETQLLSQCQELQELKSINQTYLRETHRLTELLCHQRDSLFSLRFLELSRKGISHSGLGCS